ncbi:MAG: DNA internalization-related competence protein ComEC/Rec2 [Smithellaceae bacterium]
MRRPLLFPFAGLTAGIITGNYFDLPYCVLLTGIIFVLILLLLSLRKKWLASGFLLIFTFAFILGIFDIQKQQYLTQKDQHILHYVNSGRKTVEGIVIESPSSYPDKNVLIVQCVRLIENGAYIPVTGHIRLVIPVDLNFSYGDFVRFHSVLKKIQSFNNPGGFDYGRYLNRQGIHANGFIANSSGIILLRENSASRLKLHLESFRVYLQQIIYKNAPSPQKEIIEAMTIGNQTAIPADIRDNFSKTGTSHILSISGLHIGMVAAMAFFFVSLLLKSSEYLILRLNIIKVSAAAAFVLVIIYALIADMGVTVIRSALMALIFLIALILGKQRDLYNTLALAGLVILIISPEALFDISFQLSFAAVLAIIYIVPRFGNISFQQFPVLPDWGRSVIRYLYMLILVSFAATIGTLPLIIYYFNRVSSVTIIANLIAVPLLGTLTLAIAMLFLLAAFFSPAVAGFFIKITSFFVLISIEIINKLASLSWSSFSITKPNILEIVVFYLFLTLLIQFADAQRGVKGYFLRHRLILRYSLISMLVFFIGDAIYLSLKDKLSSDLRITAIDVGQGSSLLVRFPGGGNMLIDGGGFADSSFDIGKMVIAPYLYHERISKIDTVILTHPHPDHMLGLFYILDNFNVQEFWSTEIIGDDENNQKLQKIIMERKIKTVSLPGEVTAKKIHNVEINFLWPSRISGFNARELSDADINDTSLVFQIKYGQVRFLVTGDISANIENILVMSGKDLKSDVLFVPHHGSVHSSSSDFIKKVACRYAVISAGKGNAFRHPHPLTVERYQAEQVQIMRTDQDGAITLTTEGISLIKDTFIKSKSN